jgi:hypothetical protein
MDPVVDLVLRVSLALLFATAAWHKLRAPRSFAATLGEYRLLPVSLAPVAAALVVAAELATVAALVAASRIGLAFAAGLLLVYAAAVAVNLLRGRRHIDCGCAGPSARQRIGGWLVARNLVLAATALAGLAPVAPRALVWVDAFTVVAATIALAACRAAADRLLALGSRGTATA